MPGQVQLIRPEDIHPLTDFLRNHRKSVGRLRRTKRAEVLTVHGKASVVIQDARAYQRILELAVQMETMIGIREGLDSIEEGKGMTLNEFKRKFREKYPLPGTPGATGIEGR